MTREEALPLFNGLQDEDDLLDNYEEQLFEYKKFFLSKAPIAKLFEGRTRKLLKLEEAFALLVPDSSSTNAFEAKQPNIGLPTNNSQSILEWFKAFQREKNEVKRSISNATSAKALAELVESLVALEKANAAQWHADFGEQEDIIVSKEPDPMYLLDAIKAYMQQSGETFAQLKKMENNPPELLVQEMKRLSLLFKKF